MANTKNRKDRIMANTKKNAGTHSMQRTHVARTSEKVQVNAKASKLFDAFTAKDWCELLTHRPEFADVCRWEKIQPNTCSVVDLLVA